MKKRIALLVTCAIISLSLRAQNINLGSGNYIWLHAVGDANWTFGKDNNHNINIFGHGHELRRFRILNGSNSQEHFSVNFLTGHVGIGTGNPKVKFQVEGSSGVQGRLRIAAPAVGASAAFDITMGTNDDNLGAGMRAYVPAGQPGVDRVFLGFYTTTYLNGLQSRVERLTITDRGNVGLGWSGTQPGKLNISTPGDQASIRLHGGPTISSSSLTSKWNMPPVNSDATRLSVITANWDASGGIGLIDGPGIASPVVWLYGYHPSNAFTIARKNDDGGGSNISNIDNFMAPLLQVRADGNVGIGTTNPDAKLTVKGDIHTREVRVDMNGSVDPDYVFDDAYELPTLENVEAYIKENKHLPDVPSAKEMDENGLNLKEMNLLLLKKVEELTLYVIELKKQDEKRQWENEAQQREIELLKAQMKR